MTSIAVGRLPGPSFAKYMVLEARSLALSQLKSEIEQSENITLGTDGTTKFGHHFASCQLSFSGGHQGVLGLKEMSGGSAEVYLSTIKSMVDDVAVCAGKGSSVQMTQEIGTYMSF